MKTFEVIRKETIEFKIIVQVEDEENEKDAIEIADGTGKDEWKAPEPDEYEIEYEAKEIKEDEND